MFIDLLKDNDEKWDTFQVERGEFPTTDQLSDYEAVVITGSKHDAHGSDCWIQKLKELCRAIHVRKQKLLGVCFGHQVIANALGGKSGRSDVGWKIGIQTIKLNDLAHQKFKNVPSELDLCKVHQDQVLVLPPCAEVLAQSDGVSAEIFSIGDHVLCVQGHPEFNQNIVDEIITTREKAGSFSAEVATAARKSLSIEPSRKESQQLLKQFLKRDLSLNYV
uniref:Glutamine amidotransferase YLR126C n=1 Tax=Hirondellea gigas TaxID=1518452 RepID=A0A6A7G8N2_9CRUS